jgi:uncharacterized membrane protein
MVGWGGLEIRDALIVGAILAAVVSGAGWGTRALTAGGAIAAWVIGTIVLGLGGPSCAGVIIVFFVSSVLVSNAGAEIKARPSTMFAKGTRRDAGQVAANGGFPALLAAVYGIDRVLSGGAEETASLALFAAFVGAVAAVTADTWATEIGVVARIGVAQRRPCRGRW